MTEQRVTDELVAAERDEMRANWQAALAAEAATAHERDVLQQRIDKTLAELVGLEERSRARLRQPRPNPAAYVSGEHDAYYTALNVARGGLTGAAEIMDGAVVRGGYRPGEFERAADPMALPEADHG